MFANLVETDQVYGHRNDVPGFHGALQRDRRGGRRLARAARPRARPARPDRRPRLRPDHAGHRPHARARAAARALRRPRRRAATTARSPTSAPPRCAGSPAATPPRCPASRSCREAARGPGAARGRRRIAGGACGGAAPRSCVSRRLRRRQPAAKATPSPAAARAPRPAKPGTSSSSTRC